MNNFNWKDWVFIISFMYKIFIDCWAIYKVLVAKGVL